ncbi:MAG: hypothetical protein RIF32_07525 [Leptospirales bacterium]
MPALLAAVVLTINCCHGGRYAFLFADAFVASGQHSLKAPANAAHCHSHQSASTGKSSHHEGAGERPSEPLKPATPNHEACPGCNPTLAFQDTQPTRSGLDRGEKETGDYPGLASALAQAMRSTALEYPITASIKPPTNHSYVFRTRVTPLYVINQSFLI